MTLAALAAVLRLYLHPERLAERLPVLRLLTRSVNEVKGAADRLREILVPILQGVASVETLSCDSQIGSGALPTRVIPSAGLAIRVDTQKRGSGAALAKLALAFRELPIPVLGRIHEGALVFDLRCLEDEAAFVSQLPELALRRGSAKMISKT